MGLFDDRLRGFVAERQCRLQQFLAPSRQLDAAVDPIHKQVEIAVRARAYRASDLLNGIGERFFVCFLAGIAEAREMLRRQLDSDAQGPLKRYAPVPKSPIGKNLRVLGFLKGAKRIADAVDVVLGQRAVLIAEILTQ